MLSEEIGEIQKKSHRLCDEYNVLGVDDDEKKQEILKELFSTDDFGRYRSMEKPIFINNYKEIKIGKTSIQIFISRLSVVIQLKLVTMFLLDHTVLLRQVFIHLFQMKEE